MARWQQSQPQPQLPSPSPCDFLFVRDFSTSPASLNGLAPMGVKDACAREARVATKAYDLWIATGSPDATYNWYRAVRRTGLAQATTQRQGHNAAGKQAHALTFRVFTPWLGYDTHQHHRLDSSLFVQVGIALPQYAFSQVLDFCIVRACFRQRRPCVARIACTALPCLTRFTCDSFSCLHARYLWSQRPPRLVVVSQCGVSVDE
jgi:hypothetical protein